MMNFKKYIIAFALPTFLGACESDLEKVTYDPAQNQPAVLATLEPSYILDVQLSDQPALTFEWTAPKTSYSAAITSTIEMDLTEKNFADDSQPQLIVSTLTDVKYSISHDDLNKAVMALLDAYGITFEEIPYEVSFRISSTIASTVAAFYSNVVTTTITPYAGEREYPSIAVRGGYSGWNFEQSQKVYSENSDTKYSGWIYFDGKGGDGWKFCMDENWSSEWGAPASMADEQAKVSLLTSGGGNIVAYKKNFYCFELDTETDVLTVTKSHDFVGLIGINGLWGDTDDVAMTLGTENISGKTEHYLTATIDITSADNLTWKIRADHAWDTQVNADNANFEGDVRAASGDGNFEFTDGIGKYQIKWYFNKVNWKVVVTKIS